MTTERYCREICKGNFANRVALEKTLSEYDAALKAKELRKFAEWCKIKGYGCYDWDMLIEQYEKENKDADRT